jgi:two-component system response regulator (stage 0 sporulation protein F)
MDIFSKLKDMRILLIDDDEWIRDSLRIFFEGEGCELQALETAEEGLELLKGQDYDVIITDYRLPGMDGLDFLRRIRDSHLGTMTVLITAYGNEGVVSEARSIGVQDFIEKPFTSKTIEESLSRLIQRRDEKNRPSARKTDKE